jgi:hypothetical protein
MPGRPTRPFVKPMTVSRQQFLRSIGISVAGEPLLSLTTSPSPAKIWIWSWTTRRSARTPERMQGEGCTNRSVWLMLANEPVETSYPGPSVLQLYDVFSRIFNRCSPSKGTDELRNRSTHHKSLLEPPFFRVLYSSIRKVNGLLIRLEDSLTGL